MLGEGECRIDPTWHQLDHAMNSLGSMSRLTTSHKAKHMRRLIASRKAKTRGKRVTLSQSLLNAWKVSKKGQPAAAEEGVEARLVKEYWDMARVAIPLDERCRESCKLRRDGDETASGVPRGMRPTTGLNHLVFNGHEFQQGPTRKLYFLSLIHI